MESPLIDVFFEKQYEIKSPAWSGKTIGGLAGPSDCQKKARTIFDEGVL
jgi:hypothetical protein